MERFNGSYWVRTMNTQRILDYSSIVHFEVSSGTCMYPIVGKVSQLGKVLVGDCNLRCYYCDRSNVIQRKQSKLTRDKFLDWLNLLPSDIL